MGIQAERKKKAPGQKTPAYFCDNCKCTRYTPCTCMRRKKAGK